MRVDAPCLDCGTHLVVEMRDAQVLSVSPETMVGYAYSEVGGPPDESCLAMSGDEPLPVGRASARLDFL